MHQISFQPQTELVKSSLMEFDKTELEQEIKTNFGLFYLGLGHYSISFLTFDPATFSGDQMIDYSTIEFGQQIGEGAYGTVFQAQWNGKKVAVKKMRTRPGFSSILSFAREVAVLRYTSFLSFNSLIIHKL